MRVWLLAEQYLQNHATALDPILTREIAVSVSGTSTDPAVPLVSTYSQAENGARVKDMPTSGRSTPESQERSRSTSRTHSNSISSVSSSPPDMSTQPLVGSVVSKMDLSASVATVQALSRTPKGPSEIFRAPSSISVRTGLHFSGSRENGKKMASADEHNTVDGEDHSKTGSGRTIAMESQRRKDEARKMWVDTHSKIMKGLLEDAVDRVRTA